MDHDRQFPELDETTVAPALQPALAATRTKLGFVPAALGRMAAAPILTRMFQHGLGELERTSFTLLEREVAVLALAQHIGCEVCIAMHRAALVRVGAAELAAAIVADHPLDDPRLRALAAFTIALFDTRGDVDHTRFAAFLEAGFTRPQALELLALLGTYVMSMFANRLTQAPVDPQLGG